MMGRDSVYEARFSGIKPGWKVTAVTIALLGVGLLTVGAFGAVAQQEGACAGHPMIEIVGDEGLQGFVLIGGTPTYRPGSGVVGGSGTAGDPYVIAGWCIAISEEFGEAGIRLQDTSAHVVIRDNLLIGSPTIGFKTGVMLLDSQNVRVEGNSVLDVTTGLHFTNSDGNQVVDNLIQDSSREGAFVVDSSHNVFEGNEFLDNAMQSARLVRSPDTVMTGNEIQGHSDWGVVVGHESHRSVLEGNTIRDNGDGGVLVTRAHDVSILNGEITDNGDGVRNVDATGTVISASNINDNNNGVVNFAASTVDARNNWWGCVNGPSDTWCDSVSGPVDFNPWLTSAEPDAGA